MVFARIFSQVGARPCAKRYGLRPTYGVVGDGAGLFGVPAGLLGIARPQAGLRMSAKDDRTPQPLCGIFADSAASRSTACVTADD